jgi:hypothetical protein
MTPVMFALQDVCARTGLGVASINHQIAHGRLRTVRVGHRRMVTATALDDWLALLESEATHAPLPNADPRGTSRPSRRAKAAAP